MRNRVSQRRRNRFSGCLPLLFVVGVIAGGVWLTRGWWQERIWEVLHPNDEARTLHDALSAYANGDLDRSVTDARQLYATQPTNIDALQLLVRALLYRSYADYNRELDRQQALSLTGTALRDYPLNLDVQALHAYAQQANGFTEDADRAALRVIRQDSEHLIARLTLALTYSQQGLFDAALREATVAVTIANTKVPDWRADAYRVQALAYNDLGRYQDAGQAVEQAISFQRRLIPLHFERARYAIQVGDMDTATAYYFNIIAFDNDNVKARLRLCEVSSTLGEQDAAIEYCSDVVERAPGWSDGWYFLGREYYRRGNWQAAQESLARCTSLQVAQNVPIEERRFECWYIQGQAAEVLRDCQTLLPLYAEFQAMAQTANLPQTWVYPPEGPTVCLGYDSTANP